MSFFDPSFSLDSRINAYNQGLRESPNCGKRELLTRIIAVVGKSLALLADALIHALVMTGKSPVVAVKFIVYIGSCGYCVIPGKAFEVTTELQHLLRVVASICQFLINIPASLIHPLWNAESPAAPTPAPAGALDDSEGSKQRPAQPGVKHWSNSVPPKERVIHYTHGRPGAPAAGPSLPPAMPATPPGQDPNTVLFSLKEQHGKDQDSDGSDDENAGLLDKQRRQQRRDMAYLEGCGGFAAAAAPAAPAPATPAKPSATSTEIFARPEDLINLDDRPEEQRLLAAAALPALPPLSSSTGSLRPQEVLARFLWPVRNTLDGSAILPDAGAAAAAASAGPATGLDASQDGLAFTPAQLDQFFGGGAPASDAPQPPLSAAALLASTMLFQAAPGKPLLERWATFHSQYTTKSQLPEQEVQDQLDGFQKEVNSITDEQRRDAHYQAMIAQFRSVYQAVHGREPVGRQHSPDVAVAAAATLQKGAGALAAYVSQAGGAPSGNPKEEAAEQEAAADPIAAAQAKHGKPKTPPPVLPVVDAAAPAAAAPAPAPGPTPVATPASDVRS